MKNEYPHMYLKYKSKSIYGERFHDLIVALSYRRFGRLKMRLDDRIAMLDRYQEFVKRIDMYIGGTNMVMMI